MPVISFDCLTTTVVWRTCTLTCTVDVFHCLLLCELDLLVHSCPIGGSLHLLWSLVCDFCFMCSLKQSSEHFTPSQLSLWLCSEYLFLDVVAINTFCSSGQCCSILQCTWYACAVFHLCCSGLFKNFKTVNIIIYLLNTLLCASVYF